MTELTCTHEAEVSPERAWGAWSDVGSWGEWIGHIERASLDGPVQVGTSGKLVTGGRTVAFTLVDVQPGIRFTNRSKLPLATLHAVHEVQPIDGAPDRCRLVNTVRVTGPMAWLFGRIVGKGFPEDHPAMLRAVEQRAQRPSAA